MKITKIAFFLIAIIMLVSCGSNEKKVNPKQKKVVKAQKKPVKVEPQTKEDSEELAVETSDEPSISEEENMEEEALEKESLNEEIKEEVAIDENISESVSTNSEESSVDIDSGYYVQIGAFKYKSNSDYYTQKAKDAGYDNVTIFKTTLKRVIIGPYESIQEAKPVKEHFVESGIPDTWIFNVE